MRITRNAVLLGCLAVVFVTGAAAEDADAPEGPFGDTFQYRVGGFLVDFSTDVSAGRNLLGTTIRAESDIGLDDNVSTAFFDAVLRIRPKHAIGVQSFSSEREGDDIVVGDFTWNDVTYLGGARVLSEIDVGLVKLSYRYSFVNNGKTEAGFLAGLSFYKFKVAIAGRGAILASDGSIDEIGFVRGQEDLVAPVPTFGIFVRHAITRKLIFGVSAESLDLDIGDLEGRIVDSRVTFDWFISDHVGIGGGLANTDIRYRDFGGDSKFSIDYKQDGFLLYAVVSF